MHLFFFFFAFDKATCFILYNPSKILLSKDWFSAFDTLLESCLMRGLYTCEHLLSYLVKIGVLLIPCEFSPMSFASQSSQFSFHLAFRYYAWIQKIAQPASLAKTSCVFSQRVYFRHLPSHWCILEYKVVFLLDFNAIITKGPAFSLSQVGYTELPI